MNIPVIFFQYISWHYREGVKEVFKAWKNIHWFLYHFFSINILLRTLFKPFRRIREEYGRGFDPGKVAETLAVNIIMRAVGAFIRGALLLVAVAAELGAFVFGVLLFIYYLASPLLVPIGLIVGLALLFL
ncbi:MAG: hypothetical protein A3C80_03555 [Candidatus Ryanbacteria bacterium RIFCSPHIGHO2_02_FULL_45_43]|uniref:Uncharacterized protein n=1 Tax=Candidatus Ryanbacteria bacterium RIFCSPHIGHO2_01_45_13 TaxID=1802112 RepID=A0A1G2G0D3_9BACT|nr:MAG: hypothetical protein A2718_03820 [Candidatus Ryanbacteria bacterium RIFCSPHIGHO2_01_FULL_44_130]OGZ43793.1 MAG: hypothetical protein A2W41_00190 [Candidatus Ryanbacteria bacterium RIFCSPHIGHO2_01_45_13]OGZ48003.1 MAG: hypothetical protein A3C80_03555 [Candidatus Ryanbacteria bacterium RIFCSPHIGHO2_02_FULL_45_43]OGZ50139.1 MAG: hypothetical protein A3E55_01420 [Candidatus Ryanbacteria bacterium RIFCSPHIGHO2_12_FULL_44_20]OGZ51141.1 MAG: hypothetical protein A3A17_03860 [Candidatus Ryanba